MASFVVGKCGSNFVSSSSANTFSLISFYFFLTPSILTLLLILRFKESVAMTKIEKKKDWKNGKVRKTDKCALLTGF
jgi:hypothetical protein